MKTLYYTILVSLLLSFTAESSAQSYFLVTDSVRLYSYDQQTGTWNFSGVTYLNILESSVTMDADHQPVSQTLYTYDNNIITEVLTQVFRDGVWVNSQQQFLYYDTDNLLRERIVAKWNSGQWQNLNRFTYIYDVYDKLIVYNRETWKNNEWTDFSADSLFYNTDDLLILRSARLKSSGEYVTMQYYDYNIYGQKTMMLRQDYINGGWTNVSRVNYLYNACGTETGTLTENWIDDAWTNASKTDLFYHYFITDRRIPICFHGATIYVNESKLKTYLSRGACLGECQGSSSKGVAEEQTVPASSLTTPFKIYPNPASDRVVIRITNPEQQFSAIELLDYSGKLLLKSLLPGEETEITLDISNLKTGSYILRFTGETVYSTVILKN
jgi:hypothetical protein